MIRIKLEFITPLFSRGVYEDLPEVRAPSIRGQLHWWLRALGGSASDEKAIFGSVQKDFGGRGSGVRASRIVVRVSDIVGDSDRTFPALKHKERQGNQANPKLAYAPGTTCELQFLDRLGGLSESRRCVFMRSLHAWLLMGTLGLRGTRGAGSFAWQNIEGGPEPPEDWHNYQEHIQGLTSGTPLHWALLDRTFSQAEDARHVVSDTIGGRNDRAGSNDLERLRYPLGNMKPRKTSPLRFRIARIQSEHRILAVWDGRESVTKNRPGDLSAAIALLDRKGKEIGALLKRSSIV